MSLLRKGGTGIQVGPLLGNPGGLRSVQKFLTNPIPVPTCTMVKAINLGSAVAKPYYLTVPIPTVASPTTSHASSADPSDVYTHDDDLLLDTDYTTEALSVPTIEDEYISGVNTQQTITSTTPAAQTFTPASGYTATVLRAMLYGSGIGTITVSIKATDGSGHPTGADLISTTFDGSKITSSDKANEFYDFGLGSGYALSGSTKYALVISISEGTLYWRYNSSGSFSGGNREYYSGSWQAGSGDFMFHVLSTNTLDVPPFPVPAAVGDGLYIGDTSKFNWIRFWVNQAGQGTFSITPKYYNGSTWTALSSFYGGGNGLEGWLNSSYRYLCFNQPGDWTLFTIDSKSRYWIKIEVTAYTSLSVTPYIGNIKIGAW